MPSRDPDRLRREMEQLFADLCQVPRLVASRTGFRPPVDVYRTDDPPAVTVIVELPGVDPAEVEVAVVDQTLVVRGQRARDHGERRVYQHMEIDHGPFERRIRLGEPVEADAAEASYDRGLLSVRLPVATRPSGPVRVRVDPKGGP